MPNNRLIAKYHIVCNQLQMTKEDRDALLSGYGVVSSTKLSNAQLLEIIEKLQPIRQAQGDILRQAQGDNTSTQKIGFDSAQPPSTIEGDLWRKKVMAAIGAWLRVTGQELDDKKENSDYIKAIACRASNCATFNKIGINSLRDVYYEFSRKSKVGAKVEFINKEITAKQIINN
jgi:hypothetical protein